MIYKTNAQLLDAIKQHTAGKNALRCFVASRDLFGERGDLVPKPNSKTHVRVKLDTTGKSVTLPLQHVTIPSLGYYNPISRHEVQ